MDTSLKIVASVDEYVDDALDVARSPGNPIVIGHSMGGLIAQKVAKEYESFAHHIITEPGWERPCLEIIEWLDARS